MARSELERLRQEARRLQRRANNKVSRLEGKGVKIRFSEFDPRLNLKRVDKYNKRQLNAYMNRLEKFNSRDSGFVASVEGRPIPSSMWKEYKSLEAKHNKSVQDRLDRVASVVDPGSGVTIGERDDTFYPKGRSRMRSGQERPYSFIKRDSPAGFMGAKGLRKYMDNLRRKQTRAYNTKVLKTQRYNAAQMLDSLGDGQLKDALMNLNNDQFDMLWNYTGFADSAKQKYESVSASAPIGATNNDNSDLMERVEWAASVKNISSGR